MQLVEDRPTVGLRRGEDGGMIVVLPFPYDPHIVAVVRGIPQRRFDWDRREWWAPVDDWAGVHVADVLARFPELTTSPEVDAGLPGIKGRWVGRVTAIRHDGRGWWALDTRAGTVPAALLEGAAEHDGIVLAPLTLAGALALEETDGARIDEAARVLGGELQPFQWAGVRYVLDARRAFLADEQGLGKTVQALAALEADAAYPAIVVCPASLKLNWEREARRWLPHRSVEVVEGPVAVPRTGDITILNYEIVAAHRDALARLRPGALVVDEAHYCKNPQAKRTQAVRRLVEVQEALLERFPDALHLLGRDTVAAREAAIRAFQEPGGPQLIVGATRVAAQGITLTRASNVAFLELE